MDFLTNLNSLLIAVCFILLLVLIWDIYQTRKQLRKRAQLAAYRIGLGLNQQPKAARESHKNSGESTNSQSVYRVCITGGPCAGKTTALESIASTLRDQGYNVVIVPEAATLLNKCGAMINMDKFNQSQILSFQQQLMRMQIELEDGFATHAEVPGMKSVILCDRGIMDGRVYSGEFLWQAIMDMTGYSLVQLRDLRYDCVIHMCTCAEGAEEYYGFENNESRYEDLNAAKSIDVAGMNCWVGRPELTIVDNHRVSNFEEKIQKTLQLVASKLGIGENVLVKRKYLMVCAQLPDMPQDTTTELITTTETFLVQDAGSRRKLIKRGQKQSYIYTLAEKTNSRTKFTPLDAKEYISLLLEADPEHVPLERHTICFIYDNNYFHLSRYENINHPICLLEVKTMGEVNLPPFLDIYRDISQSKKYSKWEITHKEAQLRIRMKRVDSSPGGSDGQSTGGSENEEDALTASIERSNSI